MKFCCAFNGAIKNKKNRKKINQLFSKFFFNKIVIFPKIINYFQHNVEFVKNYDNDVNFKF